MVADQKMLYTRKAVVSRGVLLSPVFTKLMPSNSTQITFHQNKRSLEAHSITSYISFCEDACIPTLIICSFNNDKPWSSFELRKLRYMKEEAYRSGDWVPRSLYFSCYAYCTKILLHTMNICTVQTMYTQPCTCSAKLFVQYMLILCII